jgi:hypothetical protein
MRKSSYSSGNSDNCVEVATDDQASRRASHQQAMVIGCKAQHDQVMSCTDGDKLDLWLGRAAGATSVGDVFKD